MGWLSFSAPYAKAGFAEWVHFLLLDSPRLSPFPCGFTGQPGWAGFPVTSPEPETGLSVFPRSPLYPNPWKTDIFFHNWHRMCLGQEPCINYKDWPPPRELEKKPDNTVGKSFPHINWHLKYVQVWWTFCNATEPNVMENHTLALVSQGTWPDVDISVRQSNFNYCTLLTHHTPGKHQILSRLPA